MSDSEKTLMSRVIVAGPKKKFCGAECPFFRVHSVLEHLAKCNLLDVQLEYREWYRQACQPRGTKTVVA